nr:LPD7 domain-containing protein [Caballeronia sp. SBC2]
MTDWASGSAGVPFVDKGREIEVRDWCSDDSLLAALQLSAQKWRELRVSGSDAYKARCAALAVEHGFKIVNPELQAQIAVGIQAKRVIARESRGVSPQSTNGLQALSLGSLADIYQRHHEDVIRGEERRERAESRVDPSRVDAMIAVRMRVTGHDQTAIMEVLRQCSPGAHGRSLTDGRD